jgi:hypothetical protein
MLEGSAGEHRVEVIIALLEKMLPPRTGVLHYQKDDPREQKRAGEVCSSR